MNSTFGSPSHSHVASQASLAGTFLTGKIFTLAAVLMITGFAYLTLFYRLDALPLYLWDESRLAVNALEMTRRDNPFVTTYDGAPDMWNTKPPLLIWIMSALLPRINSPELAIRLPSAVSALLTAYILFWFCLSFLNDRAAGLLSALILLSSKGFAGLHAGRTGDYDALLVLWITIYSLSYLLWLHSEGIRKASCLGMCTVALALAILTKGVAGLVPLPALLLYTVLQGRRREVIVSRQLYAAGAVVVVAVSTIYLAREYYNPGYLQAVFANEIAGRYFSNNEGHDEFLLYYLYKMIGGRFFPWMLWFIVSLPALLFCSRGNHLSAVVFSACFIAIFLLVIEMGRTKLPWYAGPVYPFAALVIGLAVSMAARSLHQLAHGTTALKVLLVIFFGVSLAWAVHQHLLVVRAEHHNEGRLMYGSYFRHLREVQPELSTFKVVDGDTPFFEGDGGESWINAPLIFYVQLANVAGYNVKIVDDNVKIIVGDKVVTCDEGSVRRIRIEYETRETDANGGCYLMLIVDVK